MASFIVPLNFNKLDMKDYLWNAYKIPVLAVRSYVVQQAVREDKPGAILPKRSQWYRPRSSKRMIVEMGEGKHGGPFVWPDEMDNYEEWDKEMFDKASESQEQMQDSKAKVFGTAKPSDGDKLREQAKKLLEGKDKWQPSWKEWGEGRVTEVETNVDLNATAARTEKPTVEVKRRRDKGGGGGGVGGIPSPMPTAIDI